jgi:hypothetical protein
MNAITSRIAARIQSAFSSKQAALEERRAALEVDREEGAASAEYTAVTIAAMTMALILIVMFRTGAIPHLFESLIKGMLTKFLKV